MADYAIPPRRVWVVLAACFGLAAFPWEHELRGPERAWLFITNTSSRPITLEGHELAPDACLHIIVDGPEIKHPAFRLRWIYDGAPFETTWHQHFGEIEIAGDHATTPSVIHCVPRCRMPAVTWRTLAL